MVVIQKTAYNVIKKVVHDHVLYDVGAEIKLTERQAQHLLLGGFIEQVKQTKGNKES